MSSKQKNKLLDQANRYFYHHYYGVGKNKQEAKDKLRSIRTFNEHVRVAAFAADHMGVKRLKHITKEMAQNYLQSRRDSNICKKTLSYEKKVLERILFRTTPELKLNAVAALPPKYKPLSQSNRAYAPHQIKLIMAHQNPRNGFSTELAYAAGLRADELLTLRRNDESHASSAREWRDDRFIGRDGVTYIVTGKGGLKREILIPHHLATELEKRRLDDPKEVRDRKINHLIVYDIAGGNTFSKSFSKASNKVLGWSKGAHGLRFSYAQERMDREIKGELYEDAKAIVSQELGHFRPDITERYLAP